MLSDQMVVQLTVGQLKQLLHESLDVVLNGKEDVWFNTRDAAVRLDVATYWLTHRRGANQFVAGVHFKKVGEYYYYNVAEIKKWRALSKREQNNMVAIAQSTKRKKR